MLLSINYTGLSGIFAVPTKLVDDYIKMCSALQLKVLLTALRLAAPTVESEKIAEHLGVSKSDIEDAIEYWVREKMFVSSGNSQAAFVETAPTTVALPVHEDVEKNSLNTAVQTQTPEFSPGKIAAKAFAERTKMEREEVVSLMQNEKDLNAIMQEYESVKGKPLTYSDMEILSSLYTYCGLSGDYILLAVHYCFSIGKGNMRYIEKTIASWLDDDIDSYKAAERHIEQLSKRYQAESLVRSAFGIGDRALVKSEKDFINQWFNVFNFDIPIIKLAYENTIPYTGKISFSYTNKILKSWFGKGYKTPKDVLQHENSEKQMPAGKSSYNVNDIEKNIIGNFIGQK